MKIALFLLGMFASSTTLALPMQYQMDLNFAQRLGQNTMQACENLSQPAAVVVLDQGGQVLWSQRHQNVGPHNLIAAHKKAYTAYSSKNSSLDFMRRAQTQPDAANLNTLDELLLLGGGVPVRYEQQLIGAVGVAGAGGSQQDHNCALEGIKKTLSS